jgi:hypothetical protein
MDERDVLVALVGRYLNGTIGRERFKREPRREMRAALCELDVLPEPSTR